MSSSATATPPTPTFLFLGGKATLQCGIIAHQYLDDLLLLVPAPRNISDRSLCLQGNIRICSTSVRTACRCLSHNTIRPWICTRYPTSTTQPATSPPAKSSTSISLIVGVVVGIVGVVVGTMFHFSVASDSMPSWDYHVLGRFVEIESAFGPSFRCAFIILNFLMCFVLIFLVLSLYKTSTAAQPWRVKSTLSSPSW